MENIITDAGKDHLEGYHALLEDTFPYILKKQAQEKNAVLRELQMLLADENIGTKTNRARLRFYQAYCEKVPRQRIKLDQEALELLGQIEADSAPLAAEIHFGMGYQCHALNDAQQERSHYDRSMLCLDQYGLIGTVDSIQQTIRYASCVASQKDYMAGILTMGRVLTQMKDQGLQDTLNYAKKLTVENAICPYNNEMKDRIPFPLLHQLLVTPDPAPVHMTKENRDNEVKGFVENMKTRKNESNSNLNQILGLNMDHVMATNYSDCLEKHFLE